MDRSRVVVVEDRASVLKLMATVLGNQYQVVPCSSGEEAIAEAGRGQVDVVLTDIRMPGASGFDVLRAMRSLSPSPVVVMMTAYANVADAVAAIRAGAFDYVAKPLDADEIALAVARAVEHRRELAAGTTQAQIPLDPAPEAKPEDAHSYRRAVEQARDQASRQYLTRLMRSFQGNVTRAAGQAGMTRESLHRVLRKYGVQSEQFSAPVAGTGK